MQKQRKQNRSSVGSLKALRKLGVCKANELAADIFTAVDSPVSRQLLRMLSDGDMGGIVSASSLVDPSTYTNAGSFSDDYLCVELMSKFPDRDLGIDRSAVALSKFLASEKDIQRCEYVPSVGNSVHVHGSVRFTTQAVISTASRKIASLLGSFCEDELFDQSTFGPGASTSLRRKDADLAWKFGACELHTTTSATAYIDRFRRSFPSWDPNFVVVGGSRLVTVPKNAKTDRAICIEPDLNMFLQKGIGNMLRRRLRRVGLLHPNSQLENQAGAQEASAYGQLATIDLSGASDSIHLGLVEALLPPDWFSAVERLRSDHVLLPDGEFATLLKVSSMGNGYTFELETLIFWALCRAVIELSDESERRLWVFGDDIILSSSIAPLVLSVLDRLGFTPNPKKTFISGPFRESCGKHFFLGDDVTPFYIRSAINSPMRNYWFHNSLRAYSRLLYGFDGRFRAICEKVRESVDPAIRFLIPEGIGDAGFHANWDEVAPHPIRRKHLGFSLEGWDVKCALSRSVLKTCESHGVLLKSLHLLERGSRHLDHKNVVELRPDRVSSASEIRCSEALGIGWVQVRQWRSHGPWLG